MGLCFRISVGLLVILSTCGRRVAGDADIQDDPLIVDTPVGRVRGFQQEFMGKAVYTYLGIPYAEPPVGKHRFKKPIPAEMRDRPTIIDATSFSSPCMSTGAAGKSPPSEDCLYLNIWRPACGDRPNALKPVMVWIHGGGFVFDSSCNTFYNGLPLSAYGDVVVVSMNYRLGVFGFLNLGGLDGISGNIGLFDQLAALQWVKRNINLFGGDPSLVTIFGESAGAFSVGYHLVSPLSRNLFKRAIMQSGSPDGRLGGMNVTDNVGYSWRLAQRAGCIAETVSPDGTERPVGVLECLQAVDSRKLIEIQAKMLQENMLGSFTPTVDGTFLPDVPAKLLANGRIDEQVAEILIGVTSDEGSMFLPMFAPKHFGADTPKIDENVAEAVMKKLLGRGIDEDALRDVITFYLGKYREHTYKAVYESYGDCLLTCPVVFTAEKLSDNGRRVYFYEFAYRYAKHALFRLLGLGEWSGVTHFQDVQFVFGIPLLEGETEDQEVVELSKRIMNTWATFAKTGKPADQLGREWPLFTRDDPRYLKLIPNEVPEEVGHHREGCDLWREIARRRESRLEVADT